ncbi:MAG: hypothetical protein EOM23_07785 [Candidatus Moranbacteria bacterium]|nr:hypothetical protein [Candidatus Moranbacteria bacterium]
MKFIKLEISNKQFYVRDNFIMTKISFFITSLFVVFFITRTNAQPFPKIIKGNLGDFQLLVHGKPFLMLAGELANSATSDVELMNPVWPKLRAMHLNTVLAPA